MLTLNELNTDVEAKVERHLEQLMAGDSEGGLYQLSQECVPESDLGKAEVLVSAPSLGYVPNPSDLLPGDLFKWLQLSIHSSLLTHARECFDKQREAYETMVAGFEKEDFVCSYTPLRPAYFIEKKGTMVLPAETTFHTTPFRAWKAFEKEPYEY